MLQDDSGAILLRLAGGAGPLGLGQLVEVEGQRATKSGMASLQVTSSPRRIGTQPDPPAVRQATGRVGEDVEASLVSVKGALVSTPQRSTTGALAFSIDDGSGPLRVVSAVGAGLDRSGLARDVWIEVVGVLGQDTTGSRPTEGYRLWPRRSSDVRIVAVPSAVNASTGQPAVGAGAPRGSAAASGAAASSRAPSGRTPSLSSGRTAGQRSAEPLGAASAGSRGRALSRDRSPMAIGLLALAAVGSTAAVALALWGGALGGVLRRLRGLLAVRLVRPARDPGER